MKKIMTVITLIALISTGCNGQKKQNIEKKTDQTMPETSITVNKEYDENGNIIRYDSTYSYYYSNIINNRTLSDSILDEFKRQFNDRYFFSNDPFFNDMFFQDSLMKFDFYKKNFFIDRFRKNWYHMDDLFQQMDSVKNQYFFRQFRDTVIKVP